MKTTTKKTTASKVGSNPRDLGHTSRVGSNPSDKERAGGFTPHTCQCSEVDGAHEFCPLHFFASPESSNIMGAAYHVGSGEMTITFRGGRKYSYPDVSEDLWDEFRAAESKGGFFAAKIRNSFTGTAL